MLIPIPIIIPLKISWGRKIGLMIMFSGALFIMIAAILRVYFVMAVGVSRAKPLPLLTVF
jgi:hypothetical protein